MKQLFAIFIIATLLSNNVAASPKKHKRYIGKPIPVKVAKHNSTCKR